MSSDSGTWLFSLTLSLVGLADKDTSKGLKTALMMLENDEVEGNEMDYNLVNAEWNWLKG